ncbi:MAG: hypothetical protein HQ526_07750 [Actinobacteria bacterium]|nr:hypothetical protein [Actinomycetota bacterium]
MCSSEAHDLVRLAISGLGTSARETDPTRRYADAQLAALRAAAAMVAERSALPSALPAPRGRVTNVWQLLVRFAPELAEWAELFSYSSDRRAAATSGMVAVSSREADDSLRDAASFVSRVARLLGLPARQLDLSAQFLVAR